MPKSVHSERHKLLAEALSAQRRAMGMTQAQLAKALGRHQPFVANIESGERRVDLVELIAIADEIDLDIPLLIAELRKAPHE